MAKFRMESSVKGVSAYINRLNKISETTKNTLDKNANKIGERYRDVARNNLQNSFHTQRYGDLLVNQIYYIKGKNEIKIVAGMMPDAIEQLYYAEFGAGMVDIKHPLANQVGWQYDVKQHGEKGWRYRTTENDKIETIDKDSVKSYYEEGKPFKYQRKNGSWVAWTTYSTPTLFMYNTNKQIINDGYISKLIEDDIDQIKY